MSDTASSSRPAQPSPLPGDSAEVRANESPSARGGTFPAEDDQPTIISNRAPLPAPSVSDTARRIFQGKILPGDRLGHFELVEFTGGGGMGRVFRALDRRLERAVALKILSPKQAADEDTLRRFQNEAQSAARLDHENIARVHYVGEDQGLHFIVFEFIEGMNIRTLVEQKGPLSAAQAVSYVLQVAEALVHAADREVVHRDIKPSNVLITREGRVKLIDMGLARLKREGASTADLTASGVTLGTFDYISPEQARDPRTADVRSDIYSLGCTFFYMLTGRPPFPEGTVLQKLLQHQGDQPPDVRQFRPELPDEVARVLRKMLAKDPRDRYRHPAELVEELMLLAYQVGLHPAGSRGKILVAPQGREVPFLQRHLPWIVPIAALVCIVVALDFLWDSSANRASRPPPPGRKNEVTPVAQADEPKTRSEDPIKQPRRKPGGGRPAPPHQPTEDVPLPSGRASGATDLDRPAPQPEPSPADEPFDPTESDPLSQFLAGRPVPGGLGFEPLDGGLSAAEGTPHNLGAILGVESSSGSVTGGTGGETKPTEIGPVADPVAKRTGLLLVSDSAQSDNEFTTLGAACSAAANGDVIELRYNGRREERPITLANLNVTIRAGKDYQPVVVFRPSENETDPVKYPRSMFTVTSGRLTLVSLALQLHVPRDVPADRWSLFETRGGQMIRLEKCSLSIHNAADQQPAAYHEEVAFFRAESAPDAGAAISDDRAAAAPLATIALVDCIARGEAVFLRATDLQTIHLLWDNGLLVTTEQLLSVSGTEAVARADEVFQIDLQHMTAVLRGGLCRMTDTLSTPPKLNAQIHCADSILVGVSGVPLIEQVAASTMDDVRRQITFRGDRNFYEGFDVFWTIRSLDQQASPKPMAFEDWQSYWGLDKENLPRSNQVIWKELPDPDRPVHGHTPADYTVRDRESTPRNPVLGAASDGSDAGFQADRLPPLPPPLAEEEPDAVKTPN